MTSCPYPAPAAGEDTTPAAVNVAVGRRHFARALLLALHLNETPVIARAVEAAPADAVELVAATVPLAFLQRLLDHVSSRLGPAPAGSPHLEFYVRWALALLQAHGRGLRERPAHFGGSLRSLQKALLAHREALGKLCVVSWWWRVGWLGRRACTSGTLHRQARACAFATFSSTTFLDRRLESNSYALDFLAGGAASVQRDAADSR